MLENIKIEKLVPHPQNPRKDLGDLTELAASIKANGVFQNLTVVKNNEDTYTVIIGHRRCAAAKLAGLKELPCAVVEMDEKTQLNTMLVENMQRSDLTVIEQAEGIQLLIDLGDSIADVSEKTGFSESTIRRRTKLLQYDKAEVAAAQSRGATLEDYAKLEKLNNDDDKAEALKAMGSNNFDGVLNRLMADEKAEEYLKKVKAKLGLFATEVKNDGLYSGKYDWEKVTDFRCNGYEDIDSQIENFKEPAPHTDGWEYVWYLSFKTVYLYLRRERKNEECINPAQAERNEKFRVWADKAEEINTRCYNLRKNFILSKDFLQGTLKEINRIANEYMLNRLLCSQHKLYGSSLAELTNLEYDRDEGVFTNWEMVMGNRFQSAVVNVAAAYLTSCDGPDNSYIKAYRFADTPYEQNKQLNALYYQLLIKLGYEISDEEKQLRDGTHKIYDEWPLR